MRKEIISVPASIAAVAIPPVLVIGQALSVIDPDIWWHLQTANWILQHHAWPHSDPFSYTRAGAPWAAYSWLFELLLAGLYRVLGLRGILLYTALMSAVIAWLLLELLSRYVERLWAAVLTGIGMYLTFPLLWPRPGLFTVVFFLLQLRFVLRARLDHDAKGGWWFPAMYILWANLHIQFIYGLAVLGVAAAEPAIEKTLGRSPSDEDWRVSRVLWRLLALSFVATLVNPYFFGIYGVVWQYASQTKAFDYVIELQALDFRRVKDYVELLLAMAAALMMGYRRQFRPLFVILLVSFTLAAFRAERDAWFLVTVALAIIAVVAERPAEELSPEWHKPLVAVASSFAITMTILLTGSFDEAKLRSERDQVFPAQACEFFKSQRYAGPVFSTFDWGGYLIWKMPELQVAIDGRTNLYGDDMLSSMADSWDGKPAWLGNSQLAEARIILAPKVLPLTFILSNLPKYKIVYEDDLCIILQLKD